MDTVEIRGKTYKKATSLARELGYTTDYLGQLCREGKVKAELVGRTWYALPESVRDHKESRYRSVRAQTTKHLHQDNRIKLRSIETQPTAAKRSVTYEPDTTDLFPTAASSAEATKVKNKPKTVEIHQTPVSSHMAHKNATEATTAAAGVVKTLIHTIDPATLREESKLRGLTDVAFQPGKIERPHKKRVVRVKHMQPRPVTIASRVHTPAKQVRKLHRVTAAQPTTRVRTHTPAEHRVLPLVILFVVLFLFDALLLTSEQRLSATTESLQSTIHFDANNIKILLKYR